MLYRNKIKTVVFAALLFGILFCLAKDNIILRQIHHDSYNGYWGSNQVINPDNLEQKAVIHTNEGIDIISYADNWDEARLQLLYEELLRNEHAEELKYLKEVKVYPSISDTSQEMGNYQGYWSWDDRGHRWYDNGIISLYNGDRINTVEEYARVLSHEYGHHFTMYYIWVKEGKTFKANGGWESSGYYKARNLDKYPLVSAEYKNGHYWTVHEIAAEDYVQLYGSPTVYRFATYYDVYDRFYYGFENPEPKIQHYNFYPQENSHIPFAYDIPQIEKYWSGLAGFDCKGETYDIPSISLEWTDYTIYENDDKKRLDEFYVNISSDAEDGWLYTLIVFNDKGEKYPIRTFTAADSSYCYFGYMQEKIMGEIYKEEDDVKFRKGVNYFVVNAVNEDGVAVSSNKVVLDFDKKCIYTFQEDYDLNGIVDDRDIEKILPHYGEANIEFDNNGDKIIDLFDMVRVSKLIR